jgi:hypothetical protein
MPRSFRIALYCIIAIAALTQSVRYEDDSAQSAGWASAEQREKAAARGINDPIDWELRKLADANQAYIIVEH